MRVKRRVEGAVTIFVTAPVEELERRLRERATESSGVIEERLRKARGSSKRRRVRLRGRERRPDAGRGGAGGDRRPGARRYRYHGATMIHPRIDELLEQVDSRYALVIVAAKRARQINNYHHQLGEGTFDEFAPPLIQSRSKNYLTMALEETAEGKIVYEYPKK